MENKIKLDFIGQVYASTMNKNNLGTFSILVHLKECTNSQILQQAVNDLIKRLPFLSGRLCKDFTHEVLDEPLKIISESDYSKFTDYYNDSTGHVLRVLYGERHFKVETTHTIMDGRGLVKVTSALLVRYFELMGMDIDKNDIIDCEDIFHLDEMEDAYACDAERPKPKKEIKLKAYKHDHLRPVATRISTQKFDLEKIKSNVKEYECTISEYILAHIFLAIAEERDAGGNRKAIVASVPIDYRSFFPHKTIRNFIGSKKIIMPETKDLFEMVQQIKAQFAEIDEEYAGESLNEMQFIHQDLQAMPIWFKKLAFKLVNRLNAKGMTTMFSNLGKVQLPKEIEDKVEMLEFLISPTAGLPYTFSCITVGKVLTLSITADVEGNDITETLFNKSMI